MMGSFAVIRGIERMIERNTRIPGIRHIEAANRLATWADEMTKVPQCVLNAEAELNGFYERATRKQPEMVVVCHGDRQLED